MADLDDSYPLPPLIELPAPSWAARLGRVLLSVLIIAMLGAGVVEFVYFQSELEKLNASIRAHDNSGSGIRLDPVSTQTATPILTRQAALPTPIVAPSPTLTAAKHIELQYVPEYTVGLSKGVAIVARVTSNEKPVVSQTVAITLEPALSGRFTNTSAMTDNDGLVVAHFVPAPETNTPVTIGFAVGDSRAVARLVPSEGVSRERLSLDTDQDGLPDIVEGILGTNSANPDTDGDGMWDGDEYFRLKTDPISPTFRVITKLNDLPDLFSSPAAAPSILKDQPAGLRVFVLTDTIFPGPDTTRKSLKVIVTYWIDDVADLKGAIAKGDFEVFFQQSGVEGVKSVAAPKEYWLWPRDKGPRRRISIIGFIPQEYLKSEK